MKATYLIALLGAFASSNILGQTSPDCNAPAGPNVNWSACQKEKLFINANISDGKFIATNFNLTTFYGWAHRADFRKAQLRGSKLVGYRHWGESTWKEANFESANLEGYEDKPTILEGYLAEMSFKNANLQKTTIIKANPGDASRTDFYKTKFTNADMRGIFWNYVIGYHAIFVDANMGCNERNQCVQLSHTELQYANFIRAIMTKANLSHAKLQHTTFADAQVNNVDLTYAYLEKSILRGTNLIKTDLSHAKLNGAIFNNKTKLTGTIFAHTDLRDVEFESKEAAHNLKDALWEYANLRGVNLESANFENANLKHADLQHTKLKESKLNQADLSGADLRNADLTSAALSKAILRDAKLQGAVLSKAVLDGAELSRANLSGATWVDGRVCANNSIGKCD